MKIDPNNLAASDATHKPCGRHDWKNSKKRDQRVEADGCQFSGDDVDGFQIREEQESKGAVPFFLTDGPGGQKRAGGQAEK